MPSGALQLARLLFELEIGLGYTDGQIIRLDPAGYKAKPAGGHTYQLGRRLRRAHILLT